MAAYTFAQLEGLWIQAGGHSTDAPLAASVALAESSGNPDAVSPAGAVGLWQILPSAHPQWTAAQLRDPLTNAEAAVSISHNGSNWGPWDVAWTDGLRGTAGGTLAPTGASPSGRIFQAHGGHGAPLPARAQDKPRHTVSGPPGPSGPTDKVIHLPKAFTYLTDALGKTIPTRVKWSNYASKRFIKAVK